MIYLHLTTSKQNKHKTLINTYKWGVNLARRFEHQGLTTSCFRKVVVLLWLDLTLRYLSAFLSEHRISGISPAAAFREIARETGLGGQRACFQIRAQLLGRSPCCAVEHNELRVNVSIQTHQFSSVTLSSRFTQRKTWKSKAREYQAICFRSKLN